MLEPIILPTPNDPPMPIRDADTHARVAIKKLSIIIPAYNEEKTIPVILDRINSVKLLGSIEKEIIIINDCSKDGTEAAVAGYQALANDFIRVTTAYPNEWMGYYYAAYCYTRIAWSYQDNGEKIEPFARQAETLIRKAESLAGSDNKAISEIYCVFSMVDRAYIFISPMSNGRTYGPPANQYIEKAKKANPDNARALYLDGWVKYNTPKLWGGDKKAAKELLQQALEKLKASPASPASSASPASTVFPHWGKADIELLLAQYK